MFADTNFWHQRFTRQVGWSLASRRFIFSKIGIQLSARILEVGCGTGALLDSLKTDGYANLTGIDRDLKILNSGSIKPTLAADALALPFVVSSFDLCLCHFLLLWIKNPIDALKDMKRVTRPDGWIIALAEPDYGGRIDYPMELVPLGKAQSDALQELGADVSIGRELNFLFHATGLNDIESGILSAQWGGSFDQNDFEIEWSVLRKDLPGRFSDAELARYYALDRKASIEGVRVRHVPVFYAYGRVPG